MRLTGDATSLLARRPRCIGRGPAQTPRPSPGISPGGRLSPKSCRGRQTGRFGRPAATYPDGYRFCRAGRIRPRTWPVASHARRHRYRRGRLPHEQQPPNNASSSSAPLSRISSMRFLPGADAIGVVVPERSVSITVIMFSLPITMADLGPCVIATPQSAG